MNVMEDMLELNSTSNTAYSDKTIIFHLINTSASNFKCEFILKIEKHHLLCLVWREDLMVKWKLF